MLTNALEEEIWDKYRYGELNGFTSEGDDDVQSKQYFYEHC